MNRAFTTVELLLATALAVVLMAGSLRVVASIRADLLQDQPALRGVNPGRLIDLIRWDLTHAKLLSQRNGKITLTGYGCLDRAHFEGRDRPDQPATHQPVRVEYFVWPQGERGWLVRRQVHLNELTNRNSWSELVCGGVAGIELWPVDVAGLGLGRAALLGIEDTGVPDRLRLVVRSEGDAGVDVDQVVVLR